jgi:antitoxin ParD1/3/4
MSSDRKPVPVSLPPELVEELDALVEAGVFSSRSDALRYGARLVVREDRQRRRLHALGDEGAREDVEERMERKRVS